MQGILKSNHERLCNCLQEAKQMHNGEMGLQEHEDQLKSLFSGYQEKMREIKRLILAYEEKEKTIRNEIKKIKKQNNLAESKKTSSFALGKVLVLIFLSMQRVFIVVVSEADFNSFFHL
jgi:uncharacterized protein YukE